MNTVAQKIILTGDYSPFHCLDIAGYPDSFLIGNLECAFTSEKVKTGKAYTSVLPESALDNISHSFNALNLANNHVYDAQNFTDGYQKLKERFPFIQFFGTTEKPFAEILSSKGKIAVIGCLERCNSCGPALFPEEKVLPLIHQLKHTFQMFYVYPHWGKESEYTRYPSPRQIELAHQWIDAGATGVFGHHSHVYQGKEIYQEKPVYYSLGNFYFPHPESALYDGTHTGMTLELNPDSNQVTEHFHAFDAYALKSIEQSAEQKLLENISFRLTDMTIWQWAQKVGTFYLRKSMVSWKIRIQKAPLINSLKFLIWCIMPETILFFIAGICKDKKN